LKTENKEIKYIRCDNSGENTKLREEIETEGYNIVFEFTAPDTPQQNGIVERAFATLYGRVRAMLRSSGLDQNFKNGLWAECAATATLLDNILVDKDGESNYFKFHKRHPSFIKNLHPFGQEAVVADRTPIKSKLLDRGVKCYFVGYTANHASDVFRFFKPDTRKIILSRDVTWLDKSKSIITIDASNGIDDDENKKMTKEIKKEKNKIIEGSMEYADDDVKTKFEKTEEKNEKKKIKNWAMN